MAKHYKQKFKSERVSVRKHKPDGRTYVHEEKCDGRLVAVLPYAYDERGDLVYLLRAENVSSWPKEVTVDDFYSITCIHGMMDKAGESPVEAAQRELYEEGGYRANVAEIVSLGSAPISKLEDSLYYLFAVRIPTEDIRFNEALSGPTDGTSNEQDAFSFWASEIQGAVDPLAYMLQSKVVAYLQDSITDRVVLEINHPQEDSKRKFHSAVQQLQKALHFEPEESDAPHSPLREKSPFLSVNELIDKIEEKGDERFYAAYRAIAKMLGVTRKAAGDSPFSIGGRQYINVFTGLPLTEDEWEEIEKEVSAVFGKVFEGLPEMVVMQAMALGKILAYMEADPARREPLRNFRLTEREIETLPYTTRLTLARDAAASYIVEIADDAREKVRQTILNSIRGQWDPRQLERELFENFSDLNKDWRRVAATEAQYNFQTSYLMATGIKDAANGRSYSFLLGSSDATACDFCWSHINGHVFVLVSEAPVGSDRVDINGTSYEVIWPGKTNIGRKRKEWHACVPAHPFCRCGLQAVTEGALPFVLEGSEESTENKAQERQELQGTFRE